MKKLTFILILAVTACNKQATPAPAQPIIQQQVAAPALNAWETPAAGDWKMTRSYYYSNPNPSPPVTTNTYTNPTDCHLLLSSVCNTSTAWPTAKVNANGMSTCNPTTGIWFMGEADIITIDGWEWRIQLLTNDTLILTNGRAVTAYTQKYKFYR